MIKIVGYNAYHKTPGVVAQIEYSKGSRGNAGIARRLLVAGIRGTTGGITVTDNTITEFTDIDEARTAIGARSEGARMVRAALLGNSPAVHYLALAPLSSGTAASLTWTFGGTWTTAGTIVVHIGGKETEISVSASGSPTTVAASVAAYVNADADMPCSSVATVGAVVHTVVTLGIRGNDHIAAVDISKAPVGLTVTPSGGTALGNGAYRFGGGTDVGTESVISPLAAEFSERWDYQAWSTAGATPVTDIFNQLHVKAAWDIGKYGNVCIGSNAATAPTSLASTMNDACGQIVWALNGMNHPTEYAARWMAHRAFTETDISVTTPYGDPNHNYDDELAFDGFAEFYKPGDSPSTTITDAALNTGISPIAKSADGPLKMVRSITSRYISGGVSDFRTLDTGDAVVPQRVTDTLAQLWLEDYKPANPFVGPTPASGTAPTGMGTPATWLPLVKSEMKAMEAANLLTEVDANPPLCEFNPGLNAIMTQVDCHVTRQHHATGILVRQIGTNS